MNGFANGYFLYPEDFSDCFGDYEYDEGENEEI